MRILFAVTWMNLKSLGQRLGNSLVIVVGIAGVVAVLIGMLSMTQGFERTLKGTGSDSRALLLAAGANAELPSNISRDSLPLLLALPGIRSGAGGAPLVSNERVVVTELRKGEGAKRAYVNVSLRGVEPAGLEMRREVKLVEGRWFTPGLREIVAGRQAQQQFNGIRVGGTLTFRGSQWTVVGLFSSDGDAHEAELWTDADTARSAFNRPGASSVLIQLDSPQALAPLKDAVTRDPRLQLDVSSERAYFSSQSQNFVQQVGLLTTVIAAIMAVGALFGALNTMYSAVSARQVEIATLRAIGFGGLPVAVSVMVEAVALALAGGAIGALISYGLFNGLTVSTIGQNFTQVAFSFAVTPELLVRGMVWALVLGLGGGLLPAIRAARLPIIDALRAQ